MILELQHVGKRYRGGERHALDDICLTVDAGEMVTVWGQRRSGRSTLLRIAAGVEAPDVGVVRFAGRDLASRRGAALGDGISYCRTVFRSSAGQQVIEHLTAAQMARGLPRSPACLAAWKGLERVGAEQCGAQTPIELNGEDTIRVAIARALTCQPALLVIDEPVIGVDLAARDDVLGLLRAIADDGIAVLSSAGDGPGLLGADRILSLGRGRLRGSTTPALASVTDIDGRRQAAA